MVKLKDICLTWNNQTKWPSGHSALEQKLDHCHLVAGVYKKELFKFGDDPNLYICSSHIEIFRIILKYLRCSLDFEVSYENFAGIKKDNQWNGILSLIEQNKVDFLPFPFSLADGRGELLYWDFFIPQSGSLAILSYPKATVSTSVLKLFESFTLEIWLLIALSFIIVGMAINVICCVKYHYNQWIWFINPFQIVSNYFYLFAILAGQDVQLQKMYRLVQLRTLLRTPLFVWMLATFLFQQLYSSNITAVMLSRSPHLIDRFEQLNGDYTILIELNSITQKLFVQKFPWLQRKVVLITSKQMNSIETVARLMQNNTVMVQSVKRLKRIRKAFPSIKLHISEEGFIKIPSCYGIRKTLNRTNQKRLNKLFQWLHFTGILPSNSKSNLLKQLSSLQRANPELSLDQLFKIINTPNHMMSNVTTHHNRSQQMTNDDLENLESRIELTNDQVDIRIVMQLYLFGITISVVCLLGEIVFLLRFYLFKSFLRTVASIQTNLIKRDKLN